MSTKNKNTDKTAAQDSGANEQAPVTEPAVAEQAPAEGEQGANEQGGDPAIEPTVAEQVAAEQPAEGEQASAEGAPAEQAPEAPVDPFANLPVLRLGDAENVRDMSDLETSDPRKYAKVHADAVGEKLPVVRNWKHTTAIFVPGHNKGGANGFKQGSVYGTIQQIVQAAGKAGIAAYEVAAELRRRQIGNKRSIYCVKLPPVGWAEGWLNTAVTRGIIGVHATKKAPALSVPKAEPSGTEATPEQNAKALAAA